MVVLPMVLSGAACVMTVLTLTKYSTRRLVLVALTIVFYTMRFSALATLLNFLKFESQTECQVFLLWILFLFLWMVNCIKSMCVSGQRLNDCLLMFGHVFLMIATIVAVAIFVAEYFLLETFTIKFEAFGAFTVAAELFL